MRMATKETGFDLICITINIFPLNKCVNETWKLMLNNLG